MKRCLAIAVSFLVLVSVSEAETMYVTEIMTITMRTGPGTQNKILAILKSGEEIEILNQGEGWSKIRRMNGEEGWVLTRYLTLQTPTRPMLESLQHKYDRLVEKYRISDQESARLKTENRQLKAELDENINKLAEMSSLYETLKTESSDFISVKTELEKTSKALNDVKQNEKQLENMVVKLRNNQILKGIMLGAGILLLGILLGSISKRQRRRSSLL